MTTRKNQTLSADITHRAATERTDADAAPALLPQDILAILVFLAVLRVLFPVSEIVTDLLFDVRTLSDGALTLLQSGTHLTILALSAVFAVLTRCLLIRRRKN